MSFAYLPLYTGDYIRATRHLSPDEHGCYILLLIHCWDSCGPVPLDERRQQAIVNARGGGEIEALRSVLCEFFIRMDDGWYNKRLMEEIERWNAISSKRAGAARIRWSAREKLTELGRASAMQVHSISNANAPSLSPSPSPSSEEQREEKVVHPPKPTRSAAQAQLLPAFAGDENSENINPKARVLIAGTFEVPLAWGKDAEALGWQRFEILKESEKFRQYWTAGKGLGTRRTVVGWRQSWSNWLSKAEKFK
jgi:uncharacterized protein YdaU (DUF1376 family)